MGAVSHSLDDGRKSQVPTGPESALGEESGLLERSDGRLRLTRCGRRLANEVFVRVVAPEVV